MASIAHDIDTPVLPSFCNLGTVMRTLVLANLAGLVLAVARADALRGAGEEFLALVTFLEPLILLSLPLLCGIQRWLARLPQLLQVAAVLGIELGLAGVVTSGASRLGASWAKPDLPRLLALTLIVTALLLYYFYLRGQALSPALTEARLQSLQARIRPHFLFNSINAVMSLIRAEPRRAERALADMADLFRVLMADNRRLTTLQREMDLCRQYLEIEQLRLGDRLRVDWHVDKMPGDALVPPLVLQPLIENAVYHGVEPANLAGEIVINAYRTGDQVVIVLRNPYHGEHSNHGGNKMAMANIRERLRLHFDVEASLRSQLLGKTYQVTITLPYTTTGITE